jgi:beta-glucuronidase
MIDFANRPTMRRYIAYAIALLCASTATKAETEFPLTYMQYKDVTNICAGWQFAWDAKSEGNSRGWFRSDHTPTNTAAVNLPAVWDQEPGKVNDRVLMGTGWYFRSFTVPKDWDEDISVVSLGAMHQADVWINGEFAGLHVGGYSTFSVDITKMIDRTKTNHLAIRVNNVLSKSTVPSARTGWGNYAGLYREIYLLHQPRSRVTRIEPSTTFDGKTAHLTVNLEFSEETKDGTDISLTLRLDGRDIATSKAIVKEGTSSVSLDIPTPQLWTPDSPTLHDLEVKWNDENHTMPVGLREFRRDGTRLLLNGEPIWLKGFGQHEFYSGAGPMVPSDIRRRDLEQMKTVFNCNALRAGHYPNHPDLYNICDELGILVFSEIPAWQIEGSILASDQCWEDWLEPQLSDMVLQLSHHPSVVMWGVANEAGPNPIYYNRASKFIRTMDKSRPIAAVQDSYNTSAAPAAFDLFAQNFHYGWYHSRRVYDAKRYIRAFLRKNRTAPVWVAEIGGSATIGRATGGYGGDNRGSEFYLDKINRFNLQLNTCISKRIAGVSVWTWSDFSRYGLPLTHGIFSSDRTPKLTAYSICNLMQTGPQVLILEQTDLVPAGQTIRADLYASDPDGKGLDTGDKYRWHILHNGKVSASREEPISQAMPHRTVLPYLSWTPTPAQDGEDISGLYTVCVELLRSNIWQHTNWTELDVGTASTPGILRIPPPEGDLSSAFIRFCGVRFPMYPVVGIILPFEPGTHNIEFSRDGKVMSRIITVEAGKQTEIKWPK